MKNAQRRIPITGIKKSLKSVKTPMAPKGSLVQGLGTLSLASALPRQIRPIGTDPFPTNVAVSRMNASGGKPSGPTGAPGRVEGMKSHLSFGMRATGKAIKIAIVGGVLRVLMKFQRRREIEGRVRIEGAGRGVAAVVGRMSSSSGTAVLAEVVAA